MPTEIVETWTVGPGLLKLGDPATGVEAAVLSCEVTASESVTRTESRKVLSGGQTAATERATYTFALAANFLQELEAAGVNAWSWLNKGTDQDFLYVPNNEIDRAISGVLQPSPLKIGGAVDTDGPEADATWRIQGEPAFGAYDPISGEVTPDV